MNTILMKLIKNMPEVSEGMLGCHGSSGTWRKFFMKYTPTRNKYLVTYVDYMSTFGTIDCRL